MVKALFFDAGPIISLVMSRLMWILPKLKEQYGGKFYITPSVKRELIERPIKIKRFEFEALQVMKLIKEGTLEVYHNIPNKKVDNLFKLANTTFSIKNRNMEIIQRGELESIACVLDLGADGLVMDERTLRVFVEDSNDLEKLLEIRSRKDVLVDKTRMKEFASELQKIKIIRSLELVALAYKLKLLDSYLPKGKNNKEKLIDSVLWAVKSNGCAATGKEITDLKNYLLK